MASEGKPGPQMMGAVMVDVGGVGGSHRSSWSGSSWATWTRDSLREHKSTLFWYQYNLHKLLMWATLISWISFSNWLNISWPIGNWLGIGFLRRYSLTLAILAQTWKGLWGVSPTWRLSVWLEEDNTPVFDRCHHSLRPPCPPWSPHTDCVWRWRGSASFQCEYRIRKKIPNEKEVWANDFYTSVKHSYFLP